MATTKERKKTLKTEYINLRVPEALHEALSALAEEEGCSMADLVRRALNQVYVYPTRELARTRRDA